MLEEAVNAWHDAVNRRDAAAVRAAVTDPVEVADSGGRQQLSAEAFAERILATEERLQPLSAHPVDESTMVVEQQVHRPDSAGPAAETPAPALVATMFKVRDGVIAAVRRFDSPHDALAAATSESASR